MKTPKSNLPFQSVDEHIYLIDTGLCRPRHTACYLVRAGDELAFIDTGSSNNVEGLLEITREIGLGPAAVRYVMPTHVHLDHAGGAGKLMAACPNATLVTHAKGAPHMIDPTRLQNGAMAVYGEAEFNSTFGALQPIPEQRVLAAADGQDFDLGGQRIHFLETPGHANHHGCFLAESSAALFTGDSFGLSYRELDGPSGPWLVATTTPVAFDPEAWYKSLDKMMALGPASACLTHFGKLDNPQQLAEQLRQSIQQHSDIALAEEKQDRLEGRVERLATAVDKHMVESATGHNPDVSAERVRELLALDLTLNTQGLDIWLKRRSKKRS